MAMGRAGTPYNALQMQPRGAAYGLNNQEQIMNQTGVTGQGFSSQMSPQDLSHLNQSRFQGPADYDRRSSIERADIDKMIKKH